MSMLTRARSIGRHRGKTPAQLRTELDKATCQLIDQATEINGIKGQRNQLAAELDETRIDAQRAAEDDARQIRDLRRQVADLTRKLDVGVKAEHVIAKTQELDTDEILRHCVKPVPLHQSPMADTGLLSSVVRISGNGASANPGHRPAA
ncbi:hypothetical protein AB0M68_03865 [Streptomyces sp. NPDC051453]|uniref:hypothetical protein n=1 Tax=Streptomyces sp. NPDC051453 TaxID=3154941 RepID=UPI003436D21D